ncbi:hypothetical protein, partial [uncultured Alistipes sp.]|uniref:hypothetical protein n=1 Tax=uncultured Alistipes sp. TaxID=538949 RepID=UPI003220707E
DFYTEEQEYTDIRERVKTYADACHILGISDSEEPEVIADGGLMRSDEIARRKLERITEALNEGWRPDWNNTNQYKYFPYFRILPGKGKGPDGKPNGASAGLASAYTNNAATYTYANFGSRLCFHDPELAAYAGDTFRDLYAEILVENF